MKGVEDKDIEKIKKLEEENEDLKTKLIDLSFELNYNKEKELIELVREIYSNVKEELSSKESKLTKKQILNAFKKYLEEFAKNNKIML
jgi:undecaprenyl pyrophosphate synthase